MMVDVLFQNTLQLTKMAMKIHLFPRGNTSTYSWWIFQPAMLVYCMVVGIASEKIGKGPRVSNLPIIHFQGLKTLGSELLNSNVWLFFVGFPWESKGPTPPKMPRANPQENNKALLRDY